MRAGYIFIIFLYLLEEYVLFIHNTRDKLFRLIAIKTIVFDYSLSLGGEAERFIKKN